MKANHFQKTKSKHRKKKPLELRMRQKEERNTAFLLQALCYPGIIYEPLNSKEKMLTK